MKRFKTGFLAVILFLSLVSTHSISAGATSEEIEVGIQVSPSTILLSWKAKGDVKVTVHADVSFSLFDTKNIEVWLDGVKATYIKADARGDLVAKFSFEDVSAGVDPGMATLSMRAISRTGVAYIGSDQVRVVE